MGSGLRVLCHIEPRCIGRRALSVLLVGTLLRFSAMGCSNPEGFRSSANLASGAAGSVGGKAGSAGLTGAAGDGLAGSAGIGQGSSGTAGDAAGMGGSGVTGTSGITGQAGIGPDGGAADTAAGSGGMSVAGTGGSGSSGTAGTGGGAGGQGGAPGAAGAAGAAGTTAAGAAGATGAAGDTSAGGATGSAGSSGAAGTGTTDACAQPTNANPLISDFSGTATTPVSLQQNGGTDVWTVSPVGMGSAVVAGGEMHATTTAGAWASMSTVISGQAACLNMSKYTGVKFTIKSATETSLIFEVATVETKVDYSHMRKTITLGPAYTDVSVAFADLQRPPFGAGMLLPADYKPAEHMYGIAFGVGVMTELLDVYLKNVTFY